MGVTALLTSLAEGHLLLVNNPRIKGVPCAAALYRRQAARFVRVAATDYLPDVDNLVQAATLPIMLCPLIQSQRERRAMCGHAEWQALERWYNNG